MKKYVKFIGKYPNLIPAGWVFCKLFAHNYRQYRKSVDNEEYSQCCRIWQHLGGYLEIEDLFDNSVLIVEKIAKGEILEWGSLVADFFNPGQLEKEPVYWLILDQEKQAFYPYHSAEHKAVKQAEYALFNAATKKTLSKDEIKQRSHAHFERYREFRLDPKMIAIIQDLLAKKWIEVAEDHRPRR